MSSCVDDEDYSDALLSLRSSLDLNPWVPHVSSRYTALLHETELAASGREAGQKAEKGSLRVVHLTSDGEEVSDDEDDEEDEEEEDDDDNEEEKEDDDDSDSDSDSDEDDKDKRGDSTST
jgi:hypothetical protein